MNCKKLILSFLSLLCLCTNIYSMDGSSFGMYLIEMCNELTAQEKDEESQLIERYIQEKRKRDVPDTVIVMTGIGFFCTVYSLYQYMKK